MNFNFNKEFEKMMEEHHLQSVVILGHINPDGDASGSVMALAHYIHMVYPKYKVFPYLASTLDKGPKKLVLEDSIFTPFKKPKMLEKYAVIQCDTATKSRIAGQKLYEEAEVKMVIDHHASNYGYGDINNVKISEACAENVFTILDWNQWKEEQFPTAADYVYLGILHDTSGFTRVDQVTFQAAEKLIHLGVKHEVLMKTMKAATFEDEKRRAFLYQFVKRKLDGKIAYVMIGREAIEKYGITYEDIHPFSSILRDCEDIELGFTMYEEEKDQWRCSFRSDGKWIDVNKLLQNFGGGGHAGASGLRKKTDDPEKLLEEILTKVKEMKDEKAVLL